MRTNTTATPCERSVATAFTARSICLSYTAWRLAAVSISGGGAPNLSAQMRRLMAR